ncbi:hypothetical protein BJ742DRAFT_171773 [Cladochytrium replicatum]|nr:hypothetical protein BJ742DRAFT_171773 [Cladochytrium replicatum]
MDKGKAVAQVKEGVGGLLRGLNPWSNVKPLSIDLTVPTRYLHGYPGLGPFAVEGLLTITNPESNPKVIMSIDARLIGTMKEIAEVENRPITEESVTLDINKPIYDFLVPKKAQAVNPNVIGVGGGMGMPSIVAYLSNLNTVVSPSLTQGASGETVMHLKPPLVIPGKRQLIIAFTVFVDKNNEVPPSFSVERLRRWCRLQYRLLVVLKQENITAPLEISHPIRIFRFDPAVLALYASGMEGWHTVADTTQEGVRFTVSVPRVLVAGEIWEITYQFLHRDLEHAKSDAQVVGLKVDLMEDVVFGGPTFQMLPPTELNKSVFTWNFSQEQSAIHTWEKLTKVRFKAPLWPAGKFSGQATVLGLNPSGKWGSLSISHSVVMNVTFRNAGALELIFPCVVMPATIAACEKLLNENAELLLNAQAHDTGNSEHRQAERRAAELNGVLDEEDAVKRAITASELASQSHGSSSVLTDGRNDWSEPAPAKGGNEDPEFIAALQRSMKETNLSEEQQFQQAMQESITFTVPTPQIEYGALTEDQLNRLSIFGVSQSNIGELDPLTLRQLLDDMEQPAYGLELTDTVRDTYTNLLLAQNSEGGSSELATIKAEINARHQEYIKMAADIDPEISSDYFENSAGRQIRNSDGMEGGTQNDEELPIYEQLSVEEKHIVIVAYTPTKPDEIPLSVNDVVAVNNFFGDGWAFGLNETNGRTGAFPINSITAYVVHDSKLQHRTFSIGETSSDDRAAAEKQHLAKRYGIDTDMRSSRSGGWSDPPATTLPEPSLTEEQAKMDDSGRRDTATTYAAPAIPRANPTSKSAGTSAAATNATGSSPGTLTSSSPSPRTTIHGSFRERQYSNSPPTQIGPYGPSAESLVNAGQNRTRTMSSSGSGGSPTRRSSADGGVASALQFGEAYLDRLLETCEISGPEYIRRRALLRQALTNPLNSLEEETESPRMERGPSIISTPSAPTVVVRAQTVNPAQLNDLVDAIAAAAVGFGPQTRSALEKSENASLPIPLAAPPAQEGQLPSEFDLRGRPSPPLGDGQ